MNELSEGARFAVKLIDIGGDRLKVMSAVRSARPGCGLMAAKALVDAVPQIVRGGLTMEEASTLLRRFDGLATVEIVNEDGTPIDTRRTPDDEDAASLTMPDGDFRAVAFFSGEDMGGRNWQSLTQPRLTFSDTFYRSGRCTRYWMVDGDRVASREDAEERLKTAPALDADEHAILAMLGEAWIAPDRLSLPPSPVSDGSSETARRTIAIDGLIKKALIEAGEDGVRRRPG